MLAEEGDMRKVEFRTRYGLVECWCMLSRKCDVRDIWYKRNWKKRFMEQWKRVLDDIFSVMHCPLSPVICPISQ